MAMKIQKNQFKKYKKLIVILIIGLPFSFNNVNGSEEKEATNSSKVDYTQYVNPFIGTSKMGHVFPGATSPFGMVQLSPQTNFEVMYNDDGSYNKETYEYCAGYQYRIQQL
jgi:putative alpha-1,2-mannosidase